MWILKHDTTWIFDQWLNNPAPPSIAGCMSSLSRYLGQKMTDCFQRLIGSSTAKQQGEENLVTIILPVILTFQSTPYMCFQITLIFEFFPPYFTFLLPGQSSILKVIPSLSISQCWVEARPDANYFSVLWNCFSVLWNCFSVLWKPRISCVAICDDLQELCIFTAVLSYQYGSLGRQFARFFLYFFENFGGMLWSNLITSDTFFNCSWEILSSRTKPKLIPTSSLHCTKECTVLKFKRFSNQSIYEFKTLTEAWWTFSFNKMKISDKYVSGSKKFIFRRRYFMVLALIVSTVWVSGFFQICYIFSLK